MRIKHVLFIALTVLALSLASIRATGPAIASGNSGANGGDIRAALGAPETLIAGGVSGGVVLAS